MILTALEEDILKAIASRYPYTLATVKDVYKSAKSFDKTIKILDISLANRRDVYVVLGLINLSSKTY